MHIIAPKVPVIHLTRPCQLYVVIATSLSLHLCPFLSASLYKCHYQRCSLDYMIFSSLSKIALATQVGSFTGMSDQQDLSRWKLYVKWRIYLLIDPLLSL